MIWGGLVNAAGPLIFREAAAFAAWCRKAAALERGLGFVPTMGALHTGHGALVRHSVAAHSATALSIFVNPKQFGRGEDFESYPRTFAADLELAREWGVSAVFVPSPEELYPQPFSTGITLRPELTADFEGALRPGHFEGVCLVVLILLNLAQPKVAYFGQKDYQQVVILRTFLGDIRHPVHLDVVPTVRESSGLALSSRNRYLSLSPDGHQRAEVFVRALSRSARAYLAGDRQASVLCDLLSEEIKKGGGIELDYARCLRPHTLEPFSEGEAVGAHGCSEGSPDAVLLAAVRVPLPGQSPAVVRLLDNLVLSTSGPWRGVLDDFLQRSQRDP